MASPEMLTSAPAPDASGSYRAMREALRQAQVFPECVDYVNAHGTSTPLADSLELQAVHRLFGTASKTLSMSSSKSSLGHLLGVAGEVESIISNLATQKGILPPILNLENCSESTDTDLLPFKAKETKGALCLVEFLWVWGDKCLITV